MENSKDDAISEKHLAVNELKNVAVQSLAESTSSGDGQVAENKKKEIDYETVESIKEETREVKFSEVITAVIDDMLHEEEESQKMVDALLGGCLDLICTYSEGYKSRQPLYSCKTCFAKTGQLAGICYGCAENCHDGHDLVELYTKRNFCCDCGNSKFVEKCKLYEEKDALNGRNQYNDNFKGIFCVCKKPYPPLLLEQEEEEHGAEAPCLEDMIQCPICEDWFHPTHILSDTKELAKLDPNENEQFDLICPGCLHKFPWLINYYHNFGQQSNEQNNELICKMEKFKMANDDLEETIKCFCLPLGWRNQLCRCKKCQNLYEDLNCQFLLEHEDTIDYFEQQNRERIAQRRAEEEKKNGGKNEGDALEQREFAFHVKNGIEQMERHCMDFFAKRTTEKRGAPISKEDVEECFLELSEKRQRLMVMTEGDEEEDKAAWTE